MASAGNLGQFGQEMMKILDRSQLEFRSKLNEIIDNYIKFSARDILRRGSITSYTVEDILRRFRSEILNFAQDNLQRFIQVSARQIFEIYKVTAGSLDAELNQRTTDLQETQLVLTETRKEFEDSKRRTQTLANLIEEADASIQQLMEERDSLNTTISETIRKYNEALAESNHKDEKLKELETKIDGHQSEASTAVNTLTSKLKDQEQKWRGRLEKEEQKWQLKLLQANLADSTSEQQPSSPSTTPSAEVTPSDSTETPSEEKTEGVTSESETSANNVPESENDSKSETGSPSNES
ncbi:MAG: hypothetical protein ACXAC7_06995 [Candidatus Hodarchaeales archaeon]|jgi:chromosome segregation ATPase